MDNQLQSVTLGFLGCGAMAEAIIKGIISQGVFETSQIIVSDKNPQRISHIVNLLGVRNASNVEVAKKADILLVAVKPQNIKELLEEIKDSVAGKLIISIAAGIPIRYFEEYLKRAKIIRVMPNTAALVAKSVSVFCVSPQVNIEEKRVAEKILAAIGIVIELPEVNINAVTAVSGSGPAYFFLLVEELKKAGVEAGLSEDVSYKLAAGTLVGAGALLEQTGLTAKCLREMVTSPGGTTEAALKTLDEADISAIIKKAVLSAKTKAGELS
ncbi:MAG: pyrroline-5-carboxylate reductase [Actinobacteria bacterium]|nr:MAG: pyrroline-5-carboxylate reductase [Actinomycetota bacterium]